MVIKSTAGIYRVLLLLRGRVLVSSILATWTSISLLYWIFFTPEFRTALLASLMISFLTFLLCNRYLEGFFQKTFNEIAPTYYRLRTSTITAAAAGMLLFCAIVSVEFSPPFVTSFFAAVDNQPKYTGEHPALRAVFDYLAYVNAAYEYGTSVIRGAYDGKFVRLLVLCLISSPTIYGTTLGLSVFFVPRDEFPSNL